MSLITGCPKTVRARLATLVQFSHGEERVHIVDVEFDVHITTVLPVLFVVGLGEGRSGDFVVVPDPRVPASFRARLRWTPFCFRVIPTRLIIGLEQLLRVGWW